MLLLNPKSLVVSALLALCSAHPAWSANLLAFQLDLGYPNSHFFAMNALISELATRNHSIMVSLAVLSHA